MVDIIKQFFSSSPSSRQVKSEEDRFQEILVATCALLLEMANVDGEFSEDEKDRILSILENEYDLAPEYAQEIMKQSQEELKDTIHLWQFTNSINENFDREDKIQLIEFIWQLIYLDKKLDKHEDYLVHKLSKMLNLRHSELIDAKLRARDSVQ